MTASKEELEAFDNIRMNTIRYRMKSIVGNTVSNLANILGPKSATRCSDTPLYGGTALIVAAGPSLDKNIEVLKNAFDKGHAPHIFCVNTAHPVLIKHGIRPDTVVTLESVDVSDQINERETTHVAASIASHPSCFNKASIWYGPYSPHNRPLMRALASTPIHIGASVATAAVSLALQWGARYIVLMGQDLAYTDGRCYATHTPWDKETAVEEDGMVRFNRPVEKDEWRRAQGVPRLPEKRDGFKVKGLNGEELLTTTEMINQIRWYEGLARQARTCGPYRTRLINATEGGAFIEGWDHMKLDDALVRSPGGKNPMRFYPLSVSHREAAFASLLRECDLAEQLAQRLLQGGGALPYTQLARGLPFIGGLTLGGVLALRDSDKTAWSPRERMVFRFRCWLEAAALLKTMIGHVR